MLRRRAFPLVFALAILANVLPLAVSKYLPFPDVAGHMGLLGALLHRDDAAAHVASYYQWNVRLLPTTLYDLFALWLGPHVGLPAATNLFLALFVVAALPLSVAALLFALRRDPRLALLATPLCFHRAVWYGFLNYAAGVPLALLALALVALSLDDERPRASLAANVALAVVAPLVVVAHAFASYGFLGLALVLVVLSRRGLLPSLRTLVGLAPAVWLLVRWMRSHAATEGGMLTELAAHQLNLRESLQLFYEWSIHGYGTTWGSRFDDAVLACLVVSLALATVAALRAGAEAKDSWPRRARPLVMLVGTAAIYVALPMTIHRPYWWGVSVRLVPWIWVFLLCAVPRSRRATPWWALAPATVAAVLYGGVLAHDLRTWFAPVEMGGLDEALDDIPPGKRVLGLSPSFAAEPHYAHYPVAHAVDYYVVRRGGLATPMMDGHGLDDLWIVALPRPAAPSWGDASQFRWAQHRGWDYFLVKQAPPGGKPLPPSLFESAPAGAVRKIGEHGRWSVWRRE